MSRLGFDHHGYGILERDDLEESVVYTSTGIIRAVPCLREGDVLRLQRRGKTYPQIVVTVTEHSKTEFVPVADESGREYNLWARWEHHHDEDPWLRRNGESAGEVYRLTVLNLADSEW